MSDISSILTGEGGGFVSGIESFMLENGLIKRGGGVLVGLSGGADSVALLKVLKRLSERHGISVAAAHFNHGIRGEDADKDELFCRELCEADGIPFSSERRDVPAYAKENGLSIETAGRLLRYDFLRRVKHKMGCDTIATAHHMNDNAESVLLHLLRGSGLAGLIGIKPSRDDIIRPLLCVTRAEIEAYLEEEGIPYRTDMTNLVPDGSRNRVRLELIPYIEKHINPAIVKTLCSMSGILGSDEAYLMEEARAAYERVREGNGIRRFLTAELPYPIKTRVIRLALSDADALVDIERKHLEAIFELLTARTGAYITLPGIEVRTSYELMIFGKAKAKEAFSIPLREGTVSTPAGVFRVESITGREGFFKSPNVCFMDLKKLAALGVQPEIRTRRDGDRFHPVGAAGGRKLKDFLIDRKVDREKRGELALTACGQEVLFVTGYASSELVKVDESTEKMLRIELVGTEPQSF